MYDFGKKLRELRKSRRLTQQKLADKLGVSEAMISKYEGNLAYPQFDTLRSLTAILNVSLDELCGTSVKNNVSLQGLSYEQMNAVNSLIEAFRNHKSTSTKSLSVQQCNVIGQIVSEFYK